MRRHPNWRSAGGREWRSGEQAEAGVGRNVKINGGGIGTKRSEAPPRVHRTQQVITQKCVWFQMRQNTKVRGEFSIAAGEGSVSAPRGTFVHPGIPSQEHLPAEAEGEAGRQ